MFNYIITIHNKEKLIKQVLEAIENLASENSIIYPVLDGCTDNSENITLEFKKNSKHKVIITKTPDVHELKSINAALRQISQGHLVILQDDVILQEDNLEEKILQLYKEHQNLGVVSFCRAVNLKKSTLWQQLRFLSFTPLATEKDLIQAEHDHCPGATKVSYGKFHERMCSVKSPIFISEKAYKQLGLLDEAYAPHSFDDHDYSMRALNIGYKNGLFPIHFQSELDWGTTRNSKKFLSEARWIHRKNRGILWKKHSMLIENS